jgi:triosephosphate isomerase
MQKRYLIGNWKSNMTIVDTQKWFQDFSSDFLQHPLPNEMTIVLCVPFTVLSQAKELIQQNHLTIHLGAQDVSPFGRGPYTGEVSAEMIKELATHVLIGHSERRQYFSESDEERAFQVLNAKTAGLSIIYCVPDGSEQVPESVDIVAYEPIDAIGTGKPEDPEKVIEICRKISERTHRATLYGGSITDDTTGEYVKSPDVGGLLVGGASLDPEMFFRIAKTIASTL